MEEQSPGSDVIEFGGFRRRWLPRLRRPIRGLRASTVEVAIASLAVGLIIGYASGHLSAHGPAGRQPARAATPVVSLAVPITDTGGRCALQIGRHLELGIEIANQSPTAVGIGRITPVFDLGGFHVITAGLGPCGTLTGAAAAQPPVLYPGGTEWITTTVAVLVHCPQALPVGFKVRFAQAGKISATTFNAFPDLGQLPYHGCLRSD